MDKPIEPADVEVDSLGVRLRILKGYWATLTPVRARALAYKILETWPESPSIADAAAEKAERTGDLFYSCMFCGCETNAFERACCELGQAKDRNRVTIEQMARWEEESESWCKSSKLVLVRLVAGRVLLLLDELVRTRRKLEALENEVGGDNGLRARNAAGWAIAKKRLEAHEKVTLPMPVLTRSWLDDLAAVIESRNLVVARTMIEEASKVSTTMGLTVGEIERRPAEVLDAD